MVYGSLRLLGTKPLRMEGAAPPVGKETEGRHQSHSDISKRGSIHATVSYEEFIPSLRGLDGHCFDILLHVCVGRGL